MAFDTTKENAVNSAAIVDGSIVNADINASAAIDLTKLNTTGLTASTILSADASKNFVSLALATYPSLTELSYVKGVTSAIQTQLGTKAASGANSDITSLSALSTPLSVAQGGTGDSSLTAFAVLCGGTTSTGPVQSIASVGTAGQVFTSNGAGALPTFQAASGGTKVNVSTNCETSARFIQTTVGTGAVTFGTSGMSLTTGATATSSAKSIWRLGNVGASFSIFDNSPTFEGILTMDTIGTDLQVFFGLGEPTVAGAGITYTNQHAGFKIVRSASGTNDLYATQANGTTETASASLTTLAASDQVELLVIVNSTTSVDYYWRKNGGTQSAKTTLSTNVPTGTTNGAGILFGISNAGVATSSAISVSGATFSR